jgi:hypothetical protein
MYRRCLLRALAVAPLAWQTRRGFVDLRTHAEHLFAAYQSTSPAVLHRQARQLASYVLYSLDATLAPTAVDAAILCGKTAFTSGDRHTAFNYFRAASDLAASSGRRHLRGRVLLAQSCLYSGVMGNGQAYCATNLLERAVKDLEPGLPRLYGYLRLAQEHACLRQARRAFKALNDADSQWARGRGDGLYSQWGKLASVNSSYYAGIAGEVDARLGRTQDALDGLKEALAHTTPTRRAYVLWQISMAIAHIHANDAEAACMTLGAALDTCEATGYRLGVERISRVRATFPLTWSAMACLQALDERLDAYRNGHA